jgi:hypothetical protein
MLPTPDKEVCMTLPDGRSRSASLDSETRQQLDELDALMQRMLALPVELPEEPLNSPVSDDAFAFSVEDPAANDNNSAIRHDYSADDSRNEPPASATDVVISPPSVENLERWVSSSRTPATPFAELDSPQTVEMKLAQSRRTSAENARGLRVAWPAYPLLWVNWAFEGSTAWLGPIGRWLRGPGGRALLGWSGLLLLAAALAWLAWDGLGWTW